MLASSRHEKAPHRSVQQNRCGDFYTSDISQFSISCSSSISRPVSSHLNLMGKPYITPDNMGKNNIFYLAKNKQLTQKTSEIGADFMGKTTNYMGNFRAQFPLAILLSDIWFPYLCLPSSGPPSIPVWSSYTSLYLLTTNQADNPCKFYE